MKNKINIEILFPEFCNLYADIQNMEYLKKCIPNANFIETSFNETPHFISEPINMVYLGAMTEKMQEKVINKLKEYKDKIIEKIDNNMIFLFTGNSMEIMGKYIENEDSSRVEGLGIFDIYVRRDMMNRQNSYIIEKFKDIEIIGFKSQFTKLYRNTEEEYFSEIIDEVGIDSESKYEGIMKNNFIGTYLLGPVLILNPNFTKYLLKELGVTDTKLAFEDSVFEAYNYRLNELKNLIEKNNSK